jgi:monofunctional biosynthetic peptidoglycan transglycosylase
VSAFNAVRARVRGDGKTYIFALDSVSDPRLTYWQRFTTAPGAWMEVTLPFRGFEPQWRGYTPRNAPALDPRGILNYGFFIADKQAGPFRLEVARIEAARAPEAP